MARLLFKLLIELNVRLSQRRKSHFTGVVMINAPTLVSKLNLRDLIYRNRTIGLLIKYYLNIMA